MLWRVIHLIGILFLGNTATVRVCETFSDYYVENSSNCWNNTDTELNATQIIRKWGFNAEEHYLETDDGYEILVIRSFSNISRSTAIVLGHGIYMNSLGFVDRGEKSITYILNKMGYDVWLINFRGTRYSTGHRNLTVDDLEYWNFSFHEMAMYDLPVTLDLISKTTGQKSVYIGFSMGTTVSYVFSSMLPTESSKYLTGIISLAPTAYLNNMRSVLKYGAPFWPIIKPTVKFLWKGKVLPRNEDKGKICGEDPITIYACESILVPIFGDDYQQIDLASRPVTFFLNPDTIGMNVVTHYAEIINSGKFQHQDFGKSRNIKLYGSPTPPVYNLSNINVPVSLFVGPNDWLATSRDAERFYSELGDNKCNFKYIAHDKWNHVDFVTAKDIKPLLNDLIAMEIENIELCSKNRIQNNIITD